MSARRIYKRGELIPGTVYRVVGVLGEGGMGLVYEVVDTTVDAPYVMKTLHRDLIGRKDLAARMRAEAKALAKLRHPNIVRVYTAGITSDGVPFYIMDKLNGQSLRLLVKRKGGKLPIANAIVITVQLLSALEKAHEHSIIHRDVKPDNIFLHVEDGETSTKLLDFGVMALLLEANRQTGRHFQGTLRYASPEQVAGLKVSARTDLYAAGLVLYEMIAGRGPFAGRTDMEIARAHLNDEPPWIGKLVPGLRKDLEELIMSSLEKSPDRRPRDAFRFATELREIGHRMDMDRGSDTLVNTTLDTLLGDLHDAMTESRARSAVSEQRTDLGMDVPPIEGPTLEQVPPDFTDPPDRSLERVNASHNMSKPRVDRLAPTNTAPPFVQVTPKHGTEPIAPFALAPTAPSPAPPHAREASESEPHEADVLAAQSHAAAVRSIGASITGPAPRYRALAVPLLVLAMVGVGVVSFFQGRASTAPTVPGRAAESVSTASSSIPVTAAGSTSPVVVQVSTMSLLASDAASSPATVVPSAIVATAATMRTDRAPRRLPHPLPTPESAARSSPSASGVVPAVASSTGPPPTLLSSPPPGWNDLYKTITH